MTKQEKKEESREEIKNLICTHYNKGVSPKEIAKILKEKGYKRISDGKEFSRKDINNRILHLRKAGLVSSHKQQTIDTAYHTNPNTGVNMSTSITIDKIKETTGFKTKDLAKKIKVHPATIARWKNMGIPTNALPKFEKLLNKLSGQNIPEIKNTTKVKRKYLRKTPILKEILPEEIGLKNYSESATVFVFTKDKALINELISNFM